MRNYVKKCYLVILLKEFISVIKIYIINISINNTNALFLLIFYPLVFI